MRTGRVVQVGFKSSAHDRQACDRRELRPGPGRHDATSRPRRSRFDRSRRTQGKKLLVGQRAFGFNLRKGNSEQVEANTLASIRRRTVKSRLIFDYVGNYNITDDVVATNNQRVNAGVDWFVTTRLFVRPIVVEYLHDPFQNFAERWTFGAALGYQLVDTKRISWEFNAGPAYQDTRFVSVAEGESQEEKTACVVGGDHIQERAHQGYRLHDGLPLSGGQTGSRTLYASLSHKPVHRLIRAARLRHFVRVGSRAATKTRIVRHCPEEKRLPVDLGFGFDF